MAEIRVTAKCKMVAVNELRPRERNVRLHSPDKIRALADMIRMVGWTAPIVVGPGSEVLAGHARLEAARLLGIERVPCVHVDHLTPQQCMAYVIADNRLAEMSMWDEAALLSDLKKLGNLASMAGFTPDDVAALESMLRGEGGFGEGIPTLEAPSGAPPGYGDPANERQAAGAKDPAHEIHQVVPFAREADRLVFVEFLGWLRAQRFPGSTDGERLAHYCRVAMEGPSV